MLVGSGGGKEMVNNGRMAEQVAIDSMSATWGTAFRGERGVYGGPIYDHWADSIDSEAANLP